MGSVITNELRDIEAAILETNMLLGGASGGGATADGQNTGNASLASIDGKTPALISGSVPVYVTNQLDITTISSYLLDIKNSCADIDANTDAVESKLDDVVTAINANGTVNHNDLLVVIAELQAVDANTAQQETLLTNILNKIIAAPATLAEQQTQSTSLASIDTKTPNLIDFKSPVLATDYLTAVARGLIQNEQALRLSGFDDAASTAFTAMWSQSAAYVDVTSQQTLTLSSTSASDDAPNAGARTVEVKYVRFTDLVEVTAVVALDGVTPVTVTADCYGVNSLKVLTTGSSGSNVGDIYAGFGTVTAGIPASILSVIEPLLGLSENLIYTVPFGKTLEIHNQVLSASVMTYFRYEVKPLKASNFVLRGEVVRVEGGLQIKNDMPKIFTEGQRVILQSRTAAGAGLSSAVLECVLRG